MRISDWSSDVCSSDLARARRGQRAGHRLIVAEAEILVRRARRRRLARVAKGERRYRAAGANRPAEPGYLPHVERTGGGTYQQGLLLGESAISYDEPVERQQQPRAGGVVRWRGVEGKR